jgi:hypothetical protein
VTKLGFWDLRSTPARRRWQRWIEGAAMKRRCGHGQRRNGHLDGVNGRGGTLGFGSAWLGTRRR